MNVHLEKRKRKTTSKIKAIIIFIGLTFTFIGGVSLGLSLAPFALEVVTKYPLGWIDLFTTLASYWMGFMFCYCYYKEVK